MENKIIGLYGGTFDPPHLAHVALAKAFLQSFDGARLTVMPCLIPPHKIREAGGADGTHRLEMARLAFEGLGEVSDYELTREGTSYTYLTVMHLQKLYPQHKICIIMGQDNLEIMTKWREYEFLLKNCCFAVALRGDEAISPTVDTLRRDYGAEIHLLPMEKADVSSTEIRRRLRTGEDAEKLLPAKVYNYIKREGLYRQMRDLLEIYAYINNLSPKRRTHTYGVEKAAFMLAKHHYPQLDRELVSAAALLHDCTKELSPEEQLAIAELHGVFFTELELSVPKLRHAVTGAAVARRMFGLPEEGASAILYHTTAKADMTPMEKILYLADFTDENRNDDLCKDVRRKYYENFNEDKATAMDKTLLYALERSIAILEEECKQIHPHTIEARNFLKESLADEDSKRRYKQ